MPEPFSRIQLFGFYDKYCSLKKPKCNANDNQLSFRYLIGYKKRRKADPFMIILSSAGLNQRISDTTGYSGFKRFFFAAVSIITGSSFPL